VNRYHPSGPSFANFVLQRDGATDLTLGIGDHAPDEQCDLESPALIESKKISLLRIGCRVFGR
jgi:hypothetical protein